MLITFLSQEPPALSKTWGKRSTIFSYNKNVTKQVPPQLTAAAISEKVMYKFNRIYFLLALLFLSTELLIAIYMHDSVIRPFGGDFLVVLLLYCAVKSLINTPVTVTACGVLLFSYLVEISQYFHLTTLLGLQHSRVAGMLLGNCFSITDMLLYTLGFAVIIIVENIKSGKRAFK